MSGKLDQSLDQIMSDSKPAGGAGGRGGRFRRPARRAATKAKAAIAAPTGGVQKKARPDNRSRPAPAMVSAPATGESKIIVSNLPEDVSEADIKEYFSASIGQVKRAMLTYGPQGRSRGIATIIFSEASAAPKAAKQLDGVKVDNKPMKIEVVLGARHAPAPPAPKGLADRMAKPKSAAKDRGQPKTNAAKKANGPAPATNGAGQAKGRGRGGKSGRAGRPKKKTADELDAEMMDYFGPGETATNGTAQPAAAKADGDAGMVVDDVM